jgi:hypothetical protein
MSVDDRQGDVAALLVKELRRVARLYQRLARGGRGCRMTKPHEVLTIHQDESDPSRARIEVCPERFDDADEATASADGFNAAELDAAEPIGAFAVRQMR